MNSLHTRHRKHWLALKWGEAKGNVVAASRVLGSYIADIDLCYCDECKTYSYYNWKEMGYTNIDDETIKELI